MNQCNQKTRTLARWLIAYEAGELPAEEKPQAIIRVFDRLRLMLFQLIGPYGFRSLLSRSVKVSAVSIPILSGAQVRSDGILLLGDPQPQTVPNPTEAANAAESLLMEFFEMLFSFIGTPLTLRLVRGVWANAPFDETETIIEVRS